MGMVQAVTVVGDKPTLVCSIEGQLTAIVNQVDGERFVLMREGSVEEPKGAEENKMISSDDSDEENEEDDDDDKDSIFGDDSKEAAVAIYHMQDTEKDNRRIAAGSKVKLQITDVQVSEGSIISYATLI